MPFYLLGREVKGRKQKDEWANRVILVVEIISIRDHRDGVVPILRFILSGGDIVEAS